MDLRIEDLPFEEREPLALLGIVRGREAPDLDFAGYGYATLPEVELAGTSGVSVVLRDALVLALHTPDDPEADDELEVEFELQVSSDPDDVVSVLVPLRRFLEVRVTPLVGHARDVVLALCNPRDRRPDMPAWLDDGRQLHYATGDVVAWLDTQPNGHERIRLQAEAWHTMSPTP